MDSLEKILNFFFPQAKNLQQGITTKQKPPLPKKEVNVSVKFHPSMLYLDHDPRQCSSDAI